MPPLKQNLCNFLLGFSDSISLYWIRKILLVTEPQSKKINPASIELLSTLKNTFIQVCVLILLPSLFHYLNQHLIATLLSTIFLFLTYGYTSLYIATSSSTTPKSSPPQKK
jgi:hypothetical protein